MTYNEYVQRGFVLFSSLVVLLLMLFGSYVVVMSARSNGETDYCYVNYRSPPDMPPIFELVGHRPWREDRYIAKFQTMDETVKAADVIHCPLQKAK